MNCICDLTQFLISIFVNDAISKILEKFFIEQVVLSFGMVEVVVVDADIKFFTLFKAMYVALDIEFWPLARGNHKGLSVERYRQFLNKTQAISGTETGTHLSFTDNYKTS